MGSHYSNRTDAQLAALEERERTLVDWMRRSQKGDAQAYRALLAGVQAVIQVYVRATMRRMGVEDAPSVEELSQDILIALHEKRHTYDPARPFTPWLFAIARYKMIDAARKWRTHQAERLARPLEEMSDTPGAVFADPTTRQDLDECLASLSERSRRVLELVKLEGLSVAETAAREKMSASAVKVSVHRALKALRARLAEPRPPRSRKAHHE